MRLVGLISGGKDSLYNMLQCIAAGHEIVAVANIEPHKNDELDSYMYQSVGHQAVSMIAGALSLPIYRRKTKGKAMCKSKTYVQCLSDEVEDLFALLTEVKNEKAVEGVSVGAIASDYQRTRVENVCARLGLRSFAYLWRRDQAELLQEMINAEVDAIIIKVASMGLRAEDLGRHIGEMQDELAELNMKYGVNICGEGGEYETLTLDCPLYHRAITITQSDIVFLSEDAFAPVAFLDIKNAAYKIKSMEKDDPVKFLESTLAFIRSVVKNPYNYVEDCVDEVSESIFPQRPAKPAPNLPFPFKNDDHDAVEPSPSLQEYWKKLPHLKPSSVPGSSLTTYALPNVDSTNCNFNYTTGWCALGNITAANLETALVLLQKHLEMVKYGFEDIVMVNLYVKDMAKFPAMNKTYIQFLPEVMPPARVCVATELPPDIGVVLSVVAHKLVSRIQMALTGPQSLHREAMHVQSISHWAPANIGPYSQCVKVAGIYYLAGQIPLIPGTMELLNKPLFHQCRLTLRHVERVIKAMNENMDFSNIIQAICYVTSEEIAADIHSMWSHITKNEVATVVAVTVLKLPKNAQLEWEVVACVSEDPQVTLKTETTEGYHLEMKRCSFTEPFAASLVATVQTRKTNKIQKESGMGAQEHLSILQECLQFLRAGLKKYVKPLCILKVFFRGSETTVLTAIDEFVKTSTDLKAVVTAIPVEEFGKHDVCLTVTGISH